jgi:hypothetical protein
MTRNEKLLLLLALGVMVVFFLLFHGWTTPSSSACPSTVAVPAVCPNVTPVENCTAPRAPQLGESSLSGYGSSSSHSHDEPPAGPPGETTPTPTGTPTVTVTIPTETPFPTPTSFPVPEFPFLGGSHG